MGRLEPGAPANLLIVEGDPAADITILAETSSVFLVVKNGVVRKSTPVAATAAASAQPEPFRALDPNRFKVVTLPTKPWYAFNNKKFSIAFGGGVLLDRTEFNQDGNSELQVGSLTEYDTGEVRTLRAGLGGHVLIFGKPWKYTLVGANRAFDRGFNTSTSEEWLWYDWAIGIPVFGSAELKVGKQKENISHDRLSLLVDQQFMERAAVLDALLPSRNTGATLADDALDGRMTWSLGAFTDMFGDRDAPFQDSNQYIARVSAVPYVNADTEILIHTGAGYRYSDADSGIVRFKTSPEAYFSPDFVDTGELSASRLSTISLEGGYRQGPIWLMGEYVGTDVSSSQYENPYFDGFHVTGAWAITGEVRSYNYRKGIFTKLTPERDVISGGPGAWEAVVRYSEVDLTDGLVDGGDMSRISLGMNWYATSAFKATAEYGWVDLDRFGISSTTRVLQMRMAFLLGL
jgi:phosphate-selective porin OprO/OprP